MTAESEIPSDPALWTDEHMLALSLDWLRREAKVVPEIVSYGVSFLGHLNDDTRANYAADEDCDEPGVIVAMSDVALSWFRDTTEGRHTMGKLVSLMEKPIYVEDWKRVIQ